MANVALQPILPAGRARSGLILRTLRAIARHWSDYLFIAPAMTLFAIFQIYPALRTGYISLFDWKPRGESEFVGLENYARSVSSNLFQQSSAHTLLYTVTITLSAIVLGFVAAFLVNDLFGWSKYLVRSAIFMPSISSLIVSTMIWKSFLEPDGFFQRAAAAMGVNMPSWVASTELAPLAIIVLSVWQQVGYIMVFFLAGLQNIPATFYEAAEVDGASSWAKLRHITLPLLQRTTLFVLVVTSLTNFKIFEQVFALTGGGPANSTLSLMMHIYQTAFRHSRYGQAAAMAMIFSAVAIAVALVQIRLLRARFEY
jgi:ABC-type sugar transport system permease subunit